ncbi:MAG: thioredoxin domain-containing protein [Bryobacterales bacterium]|nr:thioredoxin domain-containing protein [Bryobacterales bacterium]
MTKPLLALLVSVLPLYAEETAPTPSVVQVDVYSDFQCPFCKGFAEPVRQLERKGVNGVRVSVSFKHFPLDFHPDAALAHQAAYAAGKQGKFWEMHDTIFANQAAIKRPNLLEHAALMGLDVPRFIKDMDSDAAKQAINAEKAEGAKRGVNGTPTFFVNGKSYSGAKTYEQLRELIGGEQRRAVALAEISDAAMSKGPDTASVTLEFYADLQSPVSRPALSIIDQVMRQHPGAVRVQFRNFPLAFHPQAALAHEAAMTAARHGRFWEFAAFILEHQDSLREQDLMALAGRLGLNETLFAADMQAHKYAPRVEVDVVNGLGRGIRGSPVIFVNGKRIDGVPSLQELTERVNEGLLAKK